MSNPFDDLESDDADDAESEIDETATESTPSHTDETATEASEPATVDPSESGPAFEYSEVRQKPIYAKADAWDDFEKNVRTTIVPALADADVVDEETREIHTAVLQLANEQPERVAELILEARRRQQG